jgi:hypothetical protein
LKEEMKALGNGKIAVIRVASADVDAGYLYGWGKKRDRRV